MTIWENKITDANIDLMADTLSISKILAVLLANRDIRTKNTAKKYLFPHLGFMHDMNKMKDVDKALGLIKKNKKTAVYGDYDVDGVTSTAIIFKTLKKYGVDVSYYIPHREEEGYGLNCCAVKKLAENDVRLLICCDNGISALEEVKYAKDLGMEVIIIDHHEPGFITDSEGNKLDVLPPADAVIDPKQQSCPYPFKSLCTGGLAYKFAMEFNKYAGMDFECHDEFLVLAMIATFCDIVDLMDENRIIAKCGLDILNRNKKINLGLWSLIQAKKYDKTDINEFAVGFILGPCINASGRLQRANTAVDLLLENDEGRAMELAGILVELNEERKNITANAVENTLKRFDDDKTALSERVIVVYDADIHESIAGIVAGRIKDTLYRPTIVLTDSGDFVKGSARSIEGYNIFDELYNCRDLFIRFGGHSMAAGLSLKPENVNELSNRLNATCTLSSNELIPRLSIDIDIDLNDITYEFVNEIAVMAPFGKGNRSPLFVTRGICPEQLRVIEDKNTMIFTFPVPGSYRRVKGICFGMIELFADKLSKYYSSFECDKIMHGILRDTGLSMDLAFSAEINEYNGNVSVQMRIKDFTVNNPVSV